MDDRLDHAGPPAAAIVLLLARILLAAIFLQSGFGKLIGLEPFAGYLAANGVPAAYSLPLAVAAALVEVFGSLGVLLGFLTRAAALGMALFTVVAALIGHRFWEASDAAVQQQMMHFMKNAAIAGGFLALYVAGPGRLSLDWRRRA